MKSLAFMLLLKMKNEDRKGSCLDIIRFFIFQRQKMKKINEKKLQIVFLLFQVSLVTSMQKVMTDEF